MSRGIRLYIAMLLALVVAWLWLRAPAITGFGRDPKWPELLGVASLYLSSHLFRMLRLTLLTLDEREKALPLVAAHTLTAFPSSFFPFKLGEVLRLAAFFHVYEGRQKALAVWLSERFGDVLIISGFILSLYVFNVSVPDTMRTVFLLFVMLSALGLLGLFAVAKVFVYLNRHLVLSSHSLRGLKLLRANHALRRLELEILESVKGRLSAFFLLSVLIWALEILALSLFVSQFSEGVPDFADLFVRGLLASLPGGGAGGAGAFGLYQSLSLVVLSVLFLSAMWLGNRIGNMRGK